MKSTCVSTFSVDNAVTPLSVGKGSRFLIDRRSNCMRSKVTILAHTGLPMKAFDRRTPAESFAPDGGRSVLPDAGVAGPHALRGTRGENAIEHDGIISNKWIER